ncbi:MAG TPA: acyltransferase domain-containing protein, partial [Terriglobales bacterium]|nr:acyltransferase domain-containing protein [Terriglobales bacterium]
PASGRSRFAAVNSLGLGGTNAFMVLEEPPTAPATADGTNFAVFALSAKSDAALRMSITRHREWLSQAQAPLNDICFTSTNGRTHFPKRFAAVVNSKEQLQEALEAATGDATPPAGERRLAFLFSGQASQYAQMGAELYRHQPIFREEVDLCAKVVGNRLGRPLIDVLFGEHADPTLIDETAFTQPALFAVQAGLIALWRAWGVVPDVVLGHSIGDFAAAYCAGVYTLEQVLELIVERARLMQDLPRNGAMAAVFTNAPAVLAAIENLGCADVAIAALNAPESIVISGARDAIASLMRHFENGGIRCQLLKVSHAFHSPLMRPVIEEFGRVAAAVQGQPPKIAWLSTVSAAAMQESPRPRYWCDHVLNTVRFADTMRALGQTDISDLVEVGPGNALLALGRTILKEGGERNWLSSLNKRDELREITKSLATLYRRGFDIDWREFNRPISPRRVAMPTYPFERQRFWVESDAPPRPRDGLPNSLTGIRLRSPLPDVQFESVYSLSRFPYLDDHRIYGMAVLPTTVGLTALHDAARQYFSSDAVEIGNLQYREAMILPEHGERTVQLIFTPLSDSTAEFNFASTRTGEDDSWHTHMIGLARRQSAPSNNNALSVRLEEIKKRCANPIPVRRYYETIRTLGLEYGPSFRAIKELQRGNGEVLTRVKLPDSLTTDSQVRLHPALFDACLHFYPALVDSYGDFTRAPIESRGTYLPVGIERFSCTEVPAREVWAHGICRPSARNDVEGFVVDLFIYEDDGRLAASIEGLSLKLLTPEALVARHPSIRAVSNSPGAAGSHNTRAISTPLREGPTGQGREWLIRLVRDEAMKTLGITEAIDPGRPLREFGLDSLMSVTLANRLETALGIEISTVQLIQGPSVDQLVNELLPNLSQNTFQTAPQTTLLKPEAATGIAPTTDDEIWVQPVVTPPTRLDNGWSITSDLLTDPELPPEPAPVRLNGSAGSWINVVGPRSASQWRLFCFPFAGGGSAIYQNWANFIDPRIEVVAIEPPGRLGRITENPVADINIFVDQLLDEMDRLLDRPFAFFGHCLGALTMYETARRLIHTTRFKPEHLFVSAARPPDRITDHGQFEAQLIQDLLELPDYRIGLPIYAQSDDVFAEVIRHFNIEATDQLLRDPELRQLMLPVIRAEFQMASNYNFVPGLPWAIPITCFAAKGDPYVSREHALGWGRFTNSRLQVHIREGAHFAVVDDSAFIHSIINR